MENFKTPAEEISSPSPRMEGENGTLTQSQPNDDVLIGVIIGCGMFFTFMLLGAAVFLYCYCRYALKHTLKLSFFLI